MRLDAENGRQNGGAKLVNLKEGVELNLTLHYSR